MNFCSTVGAVILWFGNSICYMGYPTPGAMIPQMLDAQCAALVPSDCQPGRGTRIAGWDGIDPRIKFAADLAQFTPDAVIIDLVTNDFATAGMTADESIANLLWYADTAAAAGATPVLVAGYPIKDGWVAMRGAWLGDLRQRVKALGEAHGITVLDMYEPFDIRTWSACAPDGVHPTVQSCKQQIADYAARCLP